MTSTKAQPFRKSGNLFSPTAGRTFGGGPTDAFGNALGGSGNPRVYRSRYPNRKSAKESARYSGRTSPVDHPSPATGDPHFHPADEKGLKVPGSKHFEYRRRRTVSTINANNLKLQKKD